MKLTRIIAIRHGETNWNVITRIQGHLDIELNDKGRWQAEQLAAALSHEPIDAVYCSDLSRAHDTAKALATPLGLTPNVIPELRERHFGDFEGLTWQELEDKFPIECKAWKSRDPHWLPPKGESLMVTLGGVLDVLYRIATHQFDTSPRTWALGNTYINRLMWSSEGLHLVGWGDHSHLELPSTPSDSPHLG